MNGIHDPIPYPFGRTDFFYTNGLPWQLKLNGETNIMFKYSIPADGTFILGPREANGKTPL